jgi:hypothetical protein
LFISLSLLFDWSIAAIVGALPSRLKGRARPLRQRLTTATADSPTLCLQSATRGR